ncbi:MAG TPA: PEP-CTERM sorting domain-containing protein [Candidatus Sulfotelmatobacter sp.]|nr:PEP-CTERM sorting domain-containing protein [Candidatus Sulfotelmatobacter sp.]
MQRVLLFLPLLFVTLISSIAFADHIYLVPNDVGDNFAFVGRMNGHPLILSGGTPADFLNDDGYPPGLQLGGSTTLYLYSTVAWIDGVPLEFAFPPDNSIIFMPSFTLPANGKDFTMYGEIGFSARGINYETGERIDVGASARGKIPFYFSADSNRYYPGAFVQAPEPGTLGLIGTGIIGVIASARKRHKTPGSRDTDLP